MLASVARERGFTAGAALRDRGAEDHAAATATGALMAALSGWGYEPIVELEARTVELRNCPFHALVADHRDLTCHMNLAWAEGVVGGLGVTATPRLAPRPDRCCVVFDVDGLGPEAWSPPYRGD